MEVQIAVAKVNKYAVSESGDSLEVVERPNGGISVVLADGQSSGRGAKAVSLMVVRKVIGLLAEGVRDGAAARAASDALFTEKQGKVSCTLNIASIDLLTNTIVLTRNNPAPMAICRDGSVDLIAAESASLGTARDTRPNVSEFDIEPGILVVIYSDGLVHAGSRRGMKLEVDTIIQSMFEEEDPSPQAIADELLAHAVNLDESRPADDISVVAIKVTARSGDHARRMTVRLPIE
ncbi:MAG: hypothetical protein HFACDABA_00304 [Anaerolineales bacterium]|nr:hypothetical protein [Anaerolineales bacterium]